MSDPVRLKGVAASIGVAVGPARVVGRARRRLSYRRIGDHEVSGELDRFAEAVSKSRAEIESAKQELTERHGSTYAPILDVYLLMHGDALLIDATSEAILKDRVNAEWALSRVTEALKTPLLENASPYFQERARDIDHVREHLLRQLHGEEPAEHSSDGPSVLVAHDLTPADAVRMLAPPTVGLVTEMGARSSHTAILARTFGVPAVVGVGKWPTEIGDDEVVLVDGFAGEVTVRAPSDEQRQAEARRARFTALLEAERSTRAVTRDGVAISVTANVELPSEVPAVLENGAEGIGLYRTEFICLERAEPPSEDEQFAVYRGVVSAMAPAPVVFRTFDWRGDKRLRANDLGEREGTWLKAQIRAVLRASAEGSVSLMFPMVSTLAELHEARQLVEECRSLLPADQPTAGELPVGMMVEVPSAALLAARFAEQADFFAVGTNDLAHYALAFDRADSRSAARPLDPAVLHLLQRTVVAAGDAGIPCSMCGDMAADPVALGLALGLGYRRISVPVSIVPLARAVIRNLDLGVAAEAAREALGCSSADAVRELVIDRLDQDLGVLWREQGIV